MKNREPYQFFDKLEADDKIEFIRLSLPCEFCVKNIYNTCTGTVKKDDNKFVNVVCDKEEENASGKKRFTKKFEFELDKRNILFVIN